MLSENDQFLLRRWVRPGNLAAAAENVRFRDSPGGSACCEDFTEQAGQLSPFGVRTASPHFKRKTFQILERLNLSLQFRDGSRRRRPVENFRLGRFDFVFGGLVQILDILGVELRNRSSKCDGSLAATLQHLELTQPALQTLATPTQRLIDGLRRRGEPALQNRQGEANSPGPVVVLKRLRTVEFLPHVVGDDLVKAGFRLGKGIGHRVGNPLRE